MIIDCHCHAGEGDILSAPWNTAAPIEPHLQRARAAGIDRTVIFALFAREMQRANEQLARLVASHPEELIGFVRLHPTRDAGRLREQARQARQEWGFRGIKVHGGDALPTREVMEAAGEFQLPLLVDIKDQTTAVEMLATEFPEVNIIVAHLGSFGGNWQAHRATIDLMTRYDNVYADSSGVRFFDFLASAVERAGPEKLLFGSDGPLLHPGVELRRIELLGLSDEDRAKVLGGNLERLMPPQAPERR